jgi:hypothetical protein
MMTMSRKLTVEDWVKRLTQAYEVGILDDSDLQYRDDGYAGEARMVTMRDEPVFLISKNRHWHAGEKRWVPEDVPIIIMPEGLEPWTEDEWIEIAEQLRKDLSLREPNPENRSVVTKLRERRFVEQPGPEWADAG